MKELVFKIMGERIGTSFPPIPLRVIMPHQQQALINHGQSLTRLNERGGLSPREALHVLYDERWCSSKLSRRLQSLEQGEANRELRLIVKQRYVRLVEEERQAAGSPPCDHDRPQTVGDQDGVQRCKKCGCIILV